MKPIRRSFGGVASAMSLALGLLGCDRLQQHGPVPTYPDTKLEAMRTVTGETLPHDPHATAPAAVVAPSAASATAEAAPRGR